MTKSVEVVGAVIFREGQILCAQRGQHGQLPGAWEFPGGKVEHGESKAEALIREIREELSVEISVGNQVACTLHEYDFATINLTTFRCSIVAGDLSASEHSGLIWLYPADLFSLRWAPADVPAVRSLQETE